MLKNMRRRLDIIIGDFFCSVARIAIGGLRIFVLLLHIREDVRKDMRIKLNQKCPVCGKSVYFDYMHISCSCGWTGLL